MEFPHSGLLCCWDFPTQSWSFHWWDFFHSDDCVCTLRWWDFSTQRWQHRHVYEPFLN